MAIEENLARMVSDFESTIDTVNVKRKMRKIVLTKKH